MPRIIQLPSSRTEQVVSGISSAINALSQNYLRQQEEQQRMALADRDFQFRQQQADRQQANTDRGFEQRQQVIDRQLGQEDAVASYYRDKLMEMDPGPVPSFDYGSMDAGTLRNIYDSALYEKRLGEAQTRAQAAWRGTVEQYGLTQDPAMLTRVEGMLGAAMTLEDYQSAIQGAYELRSEIEAQRAEIRRREGQVLELGPTIMKLEATNPRGFGLAQALNSAYLAGDVDFKTYWNELGDLVDGGGSGERPTVPRLAFGKGMDQLAGQLASGEITPQEFKRREAELGASLGQPGYEMPGPDPAAVAGKLPADVLSGIKADAAQVSDPEKRITRAANKIRMAASKAGVELTDDELYALVEQVVN